MKIDFSYFLKWLHDAKLLLLKD